MRASTAIPPRPGSMPTVSRPRPSTRGRRPVATSRRSPRSTRAVGELEHVARRRRGAPPSACWPRCSSMPSAAQRLGERVAERLRARGRAAGPCPRRSRPRRPSGATACASSTPTGPPPRTSSRRGTSRSAGRLAVRPHAVELAQARDRRDHGSEPVAITTSPARYVVVADRDAAGAVEAARAADDVDALRSAPTRPGRRRRSREP